jgi:pimeloyl-ACP methyl ester carboxylesterase
VNAAGQTFRVPELEYLRNDGDYKVVPPGQITVTRVPKTFWFITPAIPAGRYTVFFGDTSSGTRIPGSYTVDIKPAYVVSAPGELDEGAQSAVSAGADGYIFTSQGPPLPQVDPQTLADLSGGIQLRATPPTVTATVDRSDVLQLDPLTLSSSGMYFSKVKALAPGTATITFNSSDPAIGSVTKQVVVKEVIRPCPVVFVPGTAGSELIFTSDNRRFWLGQETLLPGTITRAKSEPVRATQAVQQFDLPIVENDLKLLSLLNGKIPNSVAVDVYQQFEIWAGKTFAASGYYSAPYDWRHGASADSAAAIDAVVDKALREHPQSKKVILIGHSLGGIVARHYVQSRGRDKVAGLIAVGTPWLGAPKTARALTWGYNFDIGKFIDTKVPIAVQEGNKTANFTWYPRISLLNLADAHKSAPSWECVWQMLPTDHYQVLLGRLTGDSTQSLIWAKSYDETRTILRNANPEMFDSQLNFMRNLLNGDDFGVNHYLISGYTHSTNDQPNAEGSMDMQFVLRNQVRPDTISWWKDIVSNNVDKYIASLSRNDYGDNTSPLLSATVGQYLTGSRKNELPYPTTDANKTVLGSLKSNANAQGKVSIYPPIDLMTEGQNEFINHGSMLRNRDILKLITDSYTDRTTLPTTVATMPNVITSIEVAVTTKKDLSGPTVNEVYATIPGLTVMSQLAALPGTWPAALGNPYNGIAKRRYTEEDLNGQSISLKNAFNITNYDDWTVTHITVKVNGNIWLDQDGTWVLSSQSPTQSFVLRKP